MCQDEWMKRVEKVGGTACATEGQTVGEVVQEPVLGAPFDGDVYGIGDSPEFDRKGGRKRR
jgi:hypothetical protein